MTESILVDTVRISGFRGILNLEISLPRITVLIGMNNSGKTSLIKAIQLALGDYSRYVTEEDFYIDFEGKRIDEITVDVRFVAIGKDGKRESSFNETWMNEFGDKVKSEANGNKFVAFRTKVKPNEIKGGFECTRHTLQIWPEFDVWMKEKVRDKDKINRILSIPFISVDAQRDIHHELKDKSSFAGKVLSGVEYNQKDIIEIENLIQSLNKSAIDKSQALKNFKIHLEQLNQSFQGSGSVEITPFPKKIRDLSKHFSIHFGEGANGTFSMEYHGMGTRSWASMLTVKAFIEATSLKHEEEMEPFFPILAAEEPEAHLHPNAQRTLYQQLISSKGQVIVSTHSPYFAAIAQQSEVRHLKRKSGIVEAKYFDPTLGEEEKRRLHREIIHSRGEILFSKVLVLCEGETEEQALPLLFKKYFGEEGFVLGVNFIGVGGSGSKYLPFLTYARDFSIPVFIFSDGEEKTVTNLGKNYKKVFGETDVANSPCITLLDKHDFEGYLISAGYKLEIEAAISGIDGKDYVDKWVKTKDTELLRRQKTTKPNCKTCAQPIYEDVFRNYKGSKGYDLALKDILSSAKTKYAPAIAEELCKLENTKLPPKIIEFFEKIKNGAAL